MFLPSDITLQFGDSGDFVAEMQRRLVAVQGGSGNLVTGYFDGMTVNAVSSFQARVGLRADGIAGPDTLRRLNSVYSGEPITSSESSDTKNEEEEAARVAAQFQRDAIIAADAQAMNLAPPTPERATTEHYTEAAPVAAAAYEPRALEPLAQAADLQQMQQAQILRDTALQQQQQQSSMPPAPPSPADLLAQMLLTQPPVAQPVAPQAEPTPQQPTATSPAPQPHAHAHAGAAAGQVPPTSPAAAAPTAPALTAAPENTGRETTVLTREQAPSLVQRGLQMANAMVQKLASYFEEKLPDSVLKEVQDAGRVMAKNGVKEVAIPTGPELPARGPELPSRGPEQAQVAQRS